LNIRKFICTKLAFFEGLLDRTTCLHVVTEFERTSFLSAFGFTFWSEKLGAAGIFSGAHTPSIWWIEAVRRLSLGFGETLEFATPSLFW